MSAESNRIEYKFKRTDDFEKEVVAFLNGHGGEIFIGAANNGELAGVENPPERPSRIPSVKRA
jgi:ATP-dependent DNA helicase RecG